MTDTLTITGIVATFPRHLVTGEGLPITSFRLASTQRRFDRSKGGWVDGDTNWYTVTGFRQLAINAAGSIHKGDRVVICGRIRIREWQNGEKHGTTVEIEADAIGHDLSWGTTAFTRSISTSLAGQRPAEESAQPEDEATASWAVPGESPARGGSPADAADDSSSEAGLGAGSIPVPF